MRRPLALLLTTWIASATVPLGAQVSKQSDLASKQLNAWFAAGECAGLEGVYYENRDGGHSQISVANYPQLQALPLSEEEKADPNLMKGFARQIRPDKIVIGNASMATAAESGGSLPRQYYTATQGIGFLYAQYVHNNLFIYPEHRDHDPGINGLGGYGDLFPINTPYLLISQGSSGSDRVFIDACIKTIAAFRPEVRETLEKAKAIVPTVQKILRESYADEGVEGHYLTSKAHPVVFNGKLLDPLKMVEAANALTPETIPPVVQMSVLKEDEAVNGRDFFEPQGASEILGDSPGVIARVYRSQAAERKMTVSVNGSMSFTSGNLTSNWVVLQGDASRIRIDRLADGRSAEITITAPPGALGSSELPSRRIDIGVFVKTEHATSAPGFITFYFPPNEHRILHEDGRTLEVSYGSRDDRIRMPQATLKNYAPLLQHFRGDSDPVLSPLLSEAVAPQEQRALSVLSLKLERFAEKEGLQSSKEALSTFQTPIDQAVKDASASVRAARKEAKENPGEESDENFTAAMTRLKLAQQKQKEAAPRIAELEGNIETIKKGIAEIIETPLPEIGRTAGEVLESSFSKIADGPLLDGLYPEVVQQKSRVGKLPSMLQTFRSEMTSLAILQPKEGGGNMAIPRGEQTPANDAYHLRKYNLFLLGKILFPGALGASIGSTNFVDPRISATKLWRDVYRYDDDGKMIGWIRFQNGSYLEFDAEGRVITPEGPKPVEYGITPKTRTLEMLP